MSYSTAHWRRVGDETRRMVAEVPLYRDRPQPPADPTEVGRWLSQYGLDPDSYRREKA